MRRLFVLTGLLMVINFVKNTSGDIFNVNIGNQLTISGSRVNEKLLECSVERNGVNYTLYPTFNLTESKFMGGPFFCSFMLPIQNFDHAGEWKINAIYATNESTKSIQNIHYLRITEQLRILPVSSEFSDEIRGNSGTYATVNLADEFENITMCYIIRNQYHNDTIYMINDNGNGTSAGLEIYGQCGVRMPINEMWSGYWKLVQESGNYKVKTGTFDIKFYETTTPEQLHIQWIRGSKGMIEIHLPKFFNGYCEWEQPDGKILNGDNRNNYIVEKVTDNHAGIWKVRHAVKSDMNILEQEINVTVIDQESIDVTVTTTQKKIHMLCKTYLHKINYCLFTRPNGEIINVPPALGTDKYEYYGIGYNSISTSHFAECGLTIRQPTDDDYGLWKCTINSESKERLSAFVSTNHLIGRKNELPYVSASNVYVKRGDNFIIRCTTNQSLDYCWLRSPNGTNYSVSKSQSNLRNSLKYVGEDLSTGVCAAAIENANDTNTGNWSCRLGVVGGVELESIVAVTVTDSYIAPIQKRINAAYDAPKLRVNLLPSVDATIQYCRWIRPNGDAFNEEFCELNYSHKYCRLQSKTSCVISMKDWSTEDIGTWSCYARLTTGSDEEVYTTIDVVLDAHSASNMILNIVAVCLTTLTIVTGTIIGIILYKKRITVRNKILSLQFNEFDTSKHYPIVVNEKSNL